MTFAAVLWLLFVTVLVLVLVLWLYEVERVTDERLAKLERMRGSFPSAPDCG